jgi:hypothetical protein
MGWLLVVGAAWLLIAMVIAVLIGRSIHDADVKAAAARDAAADETVGPDVVVDTSRASDVAGAPEAGPPAAAPPPGESRPGIPSSRPPSVGGCTPASGRAPAGRRSRRG